MRDSLLGVSGELKLKERGGQPFEATATKIVPRRSVYAFINRDIISPLAGTFDGANPSSCTMRRPETMVPQQSTLQKPMRPRGSLGFTLYWPPTNFILLISVLSWYSPEIHSLKTSGEIHYR